MTSGATRIIGESQISTSGGGPSLGCRLAKDDPVLARTTTFSSDYPHSTTLWPRSQEFIAKMTKGMNQETKHAILAGNALRAYFLDGQSEFAVIPRVLQGG